jgi:uncharacterized protein (DUF58 family)
VDSDRTSIDPDLFPAAFLRLLSIVPAATRRLHAGVADGRRAVPGEGGRFLFRGHREYRPGDDPRRLDWKVAARLDRLAVREFDAERDLLTEVWLDGSASLGAPGARGAAARAAALAAAVGLAGGGRIRLGIVREGRPAPLVEAREGHDMRRVLEALSREVPAGRAGWAGALPILARRAPRGARWIVVSDLLSRADPGILQAFAGRGVRGAILHLRLPAATAPSPGEYLARDAETGERRAVFLDEAGAARVAERARAHADLWAHRATSVGFLYLPFAPETPAESLLRRLVLEVA